MRAVKSKQEKEHGKRERLLLLRQLLCSEWEQGMNGSTSVDLLSGYWCSVTRRNHREATDAFQVLITTTGDTKARSKYIIKHMRIVDRDES